MEAVTEQASQTGLKVINEVAKCGFGSQLVKKMRLQVRIPLIFHKNEGPKYPINNPVNTKHQNLKTD